jgi:hypothetical protein
MQLRAGRAQQALRGHERWARAAMLPAPAPRAAGGAIRPLAGPRPRGPCAARPSGARPDACHAAACRAYRAATPLQRGIVRWRSARPVPRAAVSTEQQEDAAAAAAPQVDGELMERIQQAQLRAGAAADIYGIPAAEWLELQVRCRAAAAAAAGTCLARDAPLPAGWLPRPMAPLLAAPPPAGAGALHGQRIRRCAQALGLGAGAALVLLMLALPMMRSC